MESAATEPPIAGSLADTLVSELRRSIVSGEIRPGERINVKELQERYGVSHIPIREALRRLEAEDLVVNIPRRGAIASEVSVDQLVELYDLRRILEPEIAARACTTMEEDQVTRVRDALRTIDDAGVSAPNSDRFITADQAFHRVVLEAAASPIVLRTLTQLWRMSERYIRLGMRMPNTAARTLEQHHNIFDAVARRDPERVREAVRVHLLLTEDAVRNVDSTVS